MIPSKYLRPIEPQPEPPPMASVFCIEDFRPSAPGVPFALAGGHAEVARPSPPLGLVPPPPASETRLRAPRTVVRMPGRGGFLRPASARALVVGEVMGDLTVIALDHVMHHYGQVARFRCRCGRTCTRIVARVRSDAKLAAESGGYAPACHECARVRRGIRPAASVEASP